MQKVDLSNVQEATDFEKLPAGAYEVTIQKVEDRTSAEYLKVDYDISAGQYKGYFTNQRKHNAEQGWSTEWVGAYCKSYKPKALGMFKRFCNAVSHSNGNYIFDGNTNADEKTLVGKKVGLVLGYEEYYSNSGDLRQRLRVVKECPVDKISEQRVPALKKVKEENKNNNMSAEVDEDGFMKIPDGAENAVPFH